MIRNFAKLFALAPCLLAIIIDVFGYGLVYPIMTAIFTNINNPLVVGLSSDAMRDFFLGLAYLLYPLFMLFGSSFMGDLSDHFGRKKIIAICMGGICLSFLLMAFGVIAASLTLLLVGRALSGLMAGSQPIAQAAISDLSTPKTKAINMSLITFVICIGLVLGPLLGGIFSDPTIASGFGFQTPFFIAAGIALVAGVWILFSFRETYVPKKKKSLSFLQPIRILIDAFFHKEVRFLVMIFILMQIGFGLYFQTILIQIKELYGYSSFLLGTFNGFMGIAFALETFFVMPLALKRWKVSTLAIFSLIFTGIAQIWGGVNANETLAWILAFPISMSNIIAYTMMMTIFSNAGDANNQGWVMGIFGASVAISFALVGASTNLLNALGTHLLIIIGGFLGILSGLGMLLYQQVRGAQPPA